MGYIEGVIVLICYVVIMKLVGMDCTKPRYWVAQVCLITMIFALTEPKRYSIEIHINNQEIEYGIKEKDSSTGI